MDEQSVETVETGNASAPKLFGNLFAPKVEEPEEVLDENGNVVKTRAQIAKEQQDLAASIAKRKVRRWYHVNPVSKVRERLNRSKLRHRRTMLQREETMKQDLERYLMELEERKSWLAYELNTRNYSRLVNEETIASSKRRELTKIEAQQLEEQKETGLKFFRGNVRGYRRWQSSPAKHLDLTGHSAPVFSCKLSKCQQYILSCSGDKTIKLWGASSGSCLKTFYGHTRKVMDTDFHPNFRAESRDPGIISCGGDGAVRSWNAISDRPTMVIKVHPEAVYKCSFSPDGGRVVTCSEDCTISTWSFPEMYLLYNYSYHSSPVTTVRFSPTGRFLVSGSDFGERKLVIWDATYPKIDQTLQFPHMIFWTETGLIRKILIKAQEPEAQFWLNQNQLSQLDQSGQEINFWLGQDDNDDPTISDSESEDEDTKAKRIDRENFGADDVKEAEGLILIADKVEGDGITVTRRAAEEYQPGGQLLIALETFAKPIAEAFGSVTIRDSRYESYSTTSGGRMGTFVATLPTPGQPALQDALALRPPFRVVPDGIKTTAKDQAFVFKSQKQLQRDREAEETRLKKIADAKKLAMAMETDPEKKRTNFLKMKQMEADEEKERNEKKPPKKSAIPAMGKNIVVLREAIKPKPRKSPIAVEAVVDPEDPLETIPEELGSPSRDDGSQASDKFAIGGKVGDSTKGSDDGSLSEKKEEKEPLDLSGMEIMWVCPPDGGMGSAVVTVNVRFEGELNWHKMTYSIRESPIKIRPQVKQALDGVGLSATEELGNIGPNGEKFMFDQEAKHNELWRFIRDENWEGVESMMTKNVIAYYDKKIVARVDKVTGMLESLFGKVCNSFVAPNPFMYRPGVTRCSVLVEATEVGTVHRGAFYKPGKYGKGGAVSGSSDESDYSDESCSDDSGSSGSYSDGSGTDGEDSYSGSSESGSDKREGNGELSRRPSNVSALSTMSQRIKISKRPKTQTMEYPSYVFSTTEGKSRKEIRKLAKMEAKEILKMRKLKVAMSEEVRHFAIAATPEDIEQHLLAGEGVSFSPMSEEQNSSSGVAVSGSPPGKSAAPTGRAKKIVRFKKNEDDSGEAKTLLKNGKFGPDESKFCMDLPDFFPSNAGQAKGALEDHLQRYEKMRKRAEKQRIKTADELREIENERANKKILPDWIRKITHYSQSDEAVLAKSLEADISLFALTESAYIARRQLAMPELPGMLPHYPGQGVDFMPDSSRLHSNAPPLPKIKAKTAVAKELAMRGPVGRGKENYTPPGIPKADISKTEMDLVLDAANAATAAENQELIADSEALKSDVSANSLTKSKNSLSRADDSTVAGVQEGAGVAEDLSLDEPSADMVHNETDSKSETTKKIKNPEADPTSNTDNGFTKKKKGFPDGVFLERRLSFPHAPGLETLSLKSMKDTHLGILAQNAFTSTSASPDAGQVDKAGASSRIIIRSAQSQQVAVASRKFDSKGKDITEPPPGYVKQLQASKGMEIAHHGTIFDAVFSPSERRLASAGGDGLIKFWDPRDGSLVRSLNGHESEVTALAYTSNEAYLVSTGADHVILVWDLMVNKVTRTLKGHVDVINSISISPDCTTLVSSSYDWTVRTWKMTPQPPAKPLPPKLVAKSDTMIMISWSAPPCFNEELTAQFLQYRVNSYHKWVPEVPISVPPSYRSKVFRNMPATTAFRFRIMAENRMGKSEWSDQSREMKTDMGLPSTCELPLVCGVTPRTLSIYWFSQSIKHYGSAPTSFIIEISGNGKEFGEGPSIEILSSDAELEGQELLVRFKEIHRSRTVVGASGGKNKGNLNYTGISIPTPHLKDAIDRSLGKDFVIMSTTIECLTPGLLYRTRIRGVNPLGVAEWSPPSLSQATLPGLAAVPEPPTIASRTLTSITWTWKPPNDGGSALTGYRLWINHWNYFVDLPRWQTTYVLGRLLPGKQYFVKILAKNVVGFTEYSECNEGTNENSFTAIEPPDIPRAPDVIAGTCRSLTIQFQLPYLNGSEITSCYVQRRLIEPFSKGPWEGERQYDLSNPRQVQLVKHIDYVAVEFDAAMDSSKKTDGSYNPFARGNKAKKSLVAKTNKYGLVGGPEYVLKKSEGSVYQIEVTGLTADTVYEFRVACRNAAGRGQYSSQSTRAKVNRAELPGVMPPPVWENVAPTLASFILTAPEFQGGVPITHYTMEVLNVDTMLATTERHIASETEFELLNLTPGARYKARVAAENKVGLGPFSKYTKVVVLPLSAADMIAMGSTDEASLADSLPPN